MKLSEAQERACDLRAHTIVTAGAGSGKTTVLTERYLRGLESLQDRPDPVRRVVALTFTEKATLEMKERAREGVRTRLRAASRRGDKEGVRFWRSVRQDLPAARISTIHAFCASLLRDFPLEAGLDPDFDIAEASDARILAHDAVRRSLQAIARHDPERHAHAAALRRLLDSYRPRELVRMLRALLDERDFSHAWRAQRRTAPPAIASIRAAYDRRIQDTAERLATGLSEADLYRLLEQAPGASRDKLADPLRGARPLVHGLLDGALSGASIESARAALLRADGRARSFSNVGSQKAWGPGLPALRRSLALLAERVHACTAWFRPWDEETESLALANESDLVALVEHAEETYVGLLGHRRRTDFAGLELHVRALLHDDVIAQRAQDRIAYLMVDEFQDTNHIQWWILHRLLTAGGANAPEDSSSLLRTVRGPGFFAVGDEKQAIYEFRGGRVEVFHEAERWVTERGGNVVHLADNFRSRSNVLACVNDVFGHVFRDPARAFDARPQTLLAKRIAQGDGRVELWPCEGEADTEEAAAIASHLEARVDAGLPVGEEDRNATWSDVAIIVFYRRFLPALRDALTSRGIPATVLGARGFHTSQEVRDVVAFLLALTDPRNAIAFASVLRSPLVGVSDPDLWRLSTLEEPDDWWQRLALAASSPGTLASVDAAATLARLDVWRRRVGTEPTATLLREAFTDSGYVAAVGAGHDGDRRVATFEKILSLTRRFERRHGIRPADLATWFTERAAVDVDDGEATETDVAGGVTLTTIHQAKGCEFPVVVIPDLTGKPRTNDGLPIIRHATLATNELALSVPPPPDTEEARRDGLTATFRYGTFKDIETERRRAEQKRVLYVAMTRARDHLFLSTRVPRSGVATGTAFEWLTTVPALRHAMDDASVTTVSLGDGTLAVRRESVALSHADTATDSDVDRLRERLRSAPPRPAAKPSPAPVRRATRVTVSELATLASNPRRYFDERSVARDSDTTPESAEPAGAELGRRVHRVLAAHARGYESTGPLSDVVQAHVDTMIRTPLWAEARTSETAWSEVPFLLATPAGDIEGMIDLVFGRGDTWTIVDYKTNRLGADRTPERVAIRNAYDIQTSLYASAWATLRRLTPRATLRTVLAFTDPDYAGARTVEWTWSAQDLPTPPRLAQALDALSQAMGGGRAEAFPERPLRTRPQLDDLLHWQRAGEPVHR